MTLMLTSCEKEMPFNGVDPEGLVHWNVISVDGPTTGLVNQIMTFDVMCPTSSGCDYVSKFVTDNSNGKTLLIKAYGGSFENSTCTQSADPIRVKYDFKPTEKGNYVLKFINRDETVIKYNFSVK